MGVGKSAVCKILNEKLSDSIFLDGDWCWNANPFVVTQETKAMVFDNIVHLLNNFISCSAYKNIVFCWVMHEQTIIDAIIKNINTDDCEVINISLTCDETSLKLRLEIDIERGKRTSDIIAKSVDRLPLYDKLDTIKIDTSDKPAESVANEIISLKDKGRENL